MYLVFSYTLDHANVWNTNKKVLIACDRPSLSFWPIAFLNVNAMQLCMSTPLTFDPCMKTAVHGLVFTPALLCLQGVSPNIVTETLSASSPEVNSLQPGDLFDIELSKIDSSLGISVTVLFGKVSALSFFFSFVSPLLTLCVCVVFLYP